jgi:DNA polymerase III subunit delta'
MERLAPLPWQSGLWDQLAGWRGRLPHAMLLHGGRGIGKRHVAQAFAQLLLCESPRGAQACGACASCQLIAADNHPDFRWLMPAADMPPRADDAEEAEEGGESVESTAVGGKPKKAPSREIVIEQVRRVGEFLGVSSHRGGRRVVLLAPAEALNGPAANALLKMLEEPPEGAVFIGASDQIDAVLPTIRSRCVLVRVPAPTWSDALGWLRGQGVEDAEARLAEAGGAPMVIPGEKAADARRRLDPGLREAFLALLARGAASTAADVVAAVPREVAVGPAIRLFQRWGWDLLGERMAQRVRYHPGHKRALTTLARAVDPPRLVEWLARLDEAQAVSEHPLNARLAVEQALLGYIDAMQGAEASR